MRGQNMHANNLIQSELNFESFMSHTSMYNLYIINSLVNDFAY